MPESLQFETPENVLVRYEAAGLGTRFVAWFLDQIFVWVLTVVLIFILVAVGISFDMVSPGFDRSDGEAPRRLVMYAAGLIMLVWGLGSFLYFGCSELLMRGQTLGKRASKIRVVKANGFRLDAASIVLRNLFRVLDQLPPLWLVPLVTRRNQRAGDLVAGTLVVSDATQELPAVRTALGDRKLADAQFRFDHATLAKATADDYSAVERLLDRWSDLPGDQQRYLLDVCSLKISKKLGLERPAATEQMRFLQDLLVAEYRRRDRGLA